MLRFLVLLTLPFFGLPAAANSWGTSGDWAINLRDGPVSTCYATREFLDGTRVEIGFAAELTRGYVAIYNADWTHIEDGQEGIVEFDFGDARFAGEAVGRIENGFPGGYALFNNPDFTDAFARRQNVRIIGREGAEFELDLTGTRNAISQIRACQAEQPTAAD